LCDLRPGDAARTRDSQCSDVNEPVSNGDEIDFQFLAENSVDIICRAGMDRVLRYVSPSCTRILGWKQEEMTGRPVDNFIITEDLPVLAAVIAVFGENATLRMLKRDGSTVWMENRARLVLDSAGEAKEWVVVMRDITERKRAEQELQFANVLLSTELETSLDAILVVDGNGKIVSVNRRFTEMWQIPSAFIEARAAEPILNAVTSQIQDPDSFLVRIRYVYNHTGASSDDELVTKDGRSIDTHSAPLTTPAGQYLGRAWFFRDITGRKLAQQQIAHLARYDGLTDLMNRTAFLEMMQQQIARVRLGAHTFAVLYFDLDHFRDVNDTFGRPVGDLVLRAVAERLRSAGREIDTVSRFGGDEFALIEIDIQEPGQAAIFADKILKAISEPFAIQDNKIRSGASIGIAVYGPDSPEAETLLSHADMALYRAKADGPGTYCFFTGAMDAEVRARVTMVTELREAIDTGQFFLMYQPQVDIDTGRIIGLEALVRWHHPKLGIVRPGKFIPAAEKSGMIVELEHWVMREACRQTKLWLDAGIAPPLVAVNVSGVRFKAPLELENDIAVILEESGLPPQYLELELTESVVMEASRKHNDLLLRLRKAGLRVAIDDFGNGYSSLDYLRRFRVERIKIAHSFIRELTTKSGNAAIVKAIIGLAHALELDVVVEGVETVEQLDLLKSWGCSGVQGYYFAKPLQVPDVTALLRIGRTTPAQAVPVQIDGV